MTIREESLKMHYEWGGKLETRSRVSVSDSRSLSLAYTPGVAEPCLAIQAKPELSYSLTRRHNVVAVITDGTAVLGLGDIGPEAGMPVMEGKCVLFREFAGIDAIPLCLRTKDPDEIVRTVSLLAGSFGGINLEDISAPRCFEIERRLKECCDIPVFHDDQHGTAVVLGAALINALKVVQKDTASISVAICGAGAAGCAIALQLIRLGVKNIVMVDSKGILEPSRMEGLQKELAISTNPEKRMGGLAEAVRGADVFIGVSAGGILTPEMVSSMAPRSIVFAMANPTPEIMPDLAKDAGAEVVGTGRSDYPNQINNVLAFPGIFRGALDVRAKEINDDMKLAASFALADLVSAQELSADYILPQAFDKRVAPAVASAVADAALRSGAADMSSKLEL